MNIFYARKFGFTLAEVLITLGVIGIVAALTLPALITKYKEKEASARLKKFYSTMQQAILLSENDNGPIEYWEKASMARDENGNFDQEANNKIAEEFFDQYLSKYINIVKRGYTKRNNRNLFQIYLTDGVSVIIGNGGCLDFLVDTNGDKKPNFLGYDKFVFLLCLNNKPAFNTYDSTLNKQEAISKCKTTPKYCSRALQLNNWEFKNYIYPEVKQTTY